jgi:sterol desaturase/sphingolipid hydroxylase (fatty acid hydroxylase superfamily)
MRLEHLLHHTWAVFLLDYLGHFLRYLLIAGPAWLLFYIFLRRRLIARKIQPLFPTSPEIRRDILYSLLTFNIFAATGVLTWFLQRHHWIHLYAPVSIHGWPYFWFTVVALIFLHDAWFYWTHRLMHWRPLFKTMHAVHHLSHNPTPWAAFAFHPTEAIVQAIIFPLVALFLPMHPLVALIWLTYMTFMNVIGHLGFELLPRGFLNHWYTRWYNTSVHHNMHHRRVHCNYGLYFNLWDRLMGTNHRQYEDEYRRITESPSPQS